MATTEHPHHGPHGDSHGAPHGGTLNHETTDVSLTGVTRLALLSAVMIGLIFAIVYGSMKTFEWLARDTRELSPLQPRVSETRLPSGPLVMTDEPGALRQLRAHEKQVLEHYGWVDKGQGIVRLPIERAMELLVEHPDRIAPAGAAPAAPAPAAPGTPATPPAAGGH